MNAVIYLLLVAAAIKWCWHCLTTVPTDLPPPPRKRVMRGMARRRQV